MRKLLIGIAIVLCTVSLAFVLLRVSGMLDYLSCPTGANEPNLKMGSHVFATNLKKPSINDFICFTAFDSMTNQNQLITFRLCAMGGDRVEIKDGKLLVNGANADKDTRLYGAYLVPKADMEKIKTLNKSIYDNAVDVFGNATICIFASEDFITNNHIAGSPMIFPVGYADETIAAQWGKDWNQDQFGAVVVPQDCYFVMGDNRHNAMDSRYRGFIPVKNYKSTVLR